MFARRPKGEMRPPLDPPARLGPTAVSVRVLRSADELRAALERAQEYERRGMREHQRRVGLYESVLARAADASEPPAPRVA